MKTRPATSTATASRRRSRAMHHITAAGLIALSRKLPEPWQSVLAFASSAFASSALSLIGVVFLAAISTWCVRWRQERGLNQLKRAAEALPAGAERSRIEQDIRRLQEAMVKQQFRALKAVVHQDEPKKIGAAKHRSRRPAPPRIR